MKQLLVLAVYLSVFSVLSAQQITVFNASSVADIIEKHSANYKSFKGNFIYKHNNKSYSGIITYVAPDLLLMQFGSASAPQNKRIVSDGKFVWVKEGDIIARQKLGTNSHPVQSWNITRLRRQYIATVPVTGLKTMFGKIPAYHIMFQPKHNATAFRSIEMISDRNGLIYRISGVSRIGVKTELSLNYTEFNKQYDPSVFVLQTTEDSQIYDNVFE
ncbi:MAG: LolA family protein [Brevinemataceae bacterium]